MKIKVCGLKYEDNIKAISHLNVDFIGFIFYKNSPRFVTNLPSSLQNFPTKKVGVFVNDDIKNILFMQKKYNFDFIQLHGNEPLDYVMRLHKSVRIIKSFSIGNNFKFNVLDKYKNVVSYFLFDTKSTKLGGSGKKFNWDILSKYYLNIPYFLSGGIDENDAEKLKNLHLTQLYGVDINSQFENYPGYKNVEKIKNFLITLRT